MRSETSFSYGENTPAPNGLASPEEVSARLIVLGITNLGGSVFRWDIIRHRQDKLLQPLFWSEELNFEIRGKLNFPNFTNCLLG